MTDQFHRFPDLPPELRVKIWKFHLHVPRRIEILEKSLSECEDCMGFDYYKYVGGSPPALLSVNQESRHEGLRYYRRIQRAGPLDPKVEHCEHHRPDDYLLNDRNPRWADCIYLNSPVDIVSCSYDFAYSGYLFHSLVLDRIEHLEITADSRGLGSVTMSDYDLDNLIMDLRHVEPMKSLKLITDYTGPDSWSPERRMDSFMTDVEQIIHYYKFWQFPEVTLARKDTGLVLAKRQLCPHKEKQESYEWELMGVKTTYPRIDTIGEPEVDTSA